MVDLSDMRYNAQHGDFFFAKFGIRDYIRKSPVFILSNQCDKNDDVVICLCTSQPAKSEFDAKVQLRKETYVRTNKIHTISRSQLLFRIDHQFGPGEYEAIINKLKKALDLKT